MVWLGKKPTTRLPRDQETHQGNYPDQQEAQKQRVSEAETGRAFGIHRFDKGSNETTFIWSRLKNCFFHGWNSA